MDRELERLRRELKREKEKAEKRREINKIIQEKRALQRELFIIKNPSLTRFRRGFKILTKKVGKGMYTYAQRMKEEQERQRKKGIIRQKKTRRKRSIGIRKRR